MDILEAILYIETEENPDNSTYLEAFQLLIDTGRVWSLQGWYGRTATYLIDEGLVTH